MTFYEQEEQFWHRFGAKLSSLKRNHRSTAAPACARFPQAKHWAHGFQDDGHACLRQNAQEAISEALSKTVLQGSVMDDTQLRLHQLALELATAHHSTATRLDRLLSHKGDVTEAKMRQQARLCASLDARLSAAHSSIDAAAAETRTWLQCAESVLQALALQLSGVATPDTEAMAALQEQKNQLLERAHSLPDPSTHSSLPGLFQGGVDDERCTRDQNCSDCISSGQQLQQLQKRLHEAEADTAQLRLQVNNMHTAQTAISSSGPEKAAIEKLTGHHSSQAALGNEGSTDAHKRSGHMPGSLRAAVCGHAHTASNDLDLDLSGGDVRAAYRAAVSRLKQDFDQRLAQAELRFMQQAHQAAGDSFAPHSYTSGKPAAREPAQGQHTTTNDVTRQLQELQVNLHDQGLMHRRNRNLSAAPGVRALAFSALSHVQHPSATSLSQPSGHARDSVAHASTNPQVHAAHAHTTSPAREHLPHSAAPDPQQTREVSLREALQLTGPSAASFSAPGRHGNRTASASNCNIDTHGTAVNNSIDLSPQQAANSSATDDELKSQAQQRLKSRSSSPSAGGTGLGSTWAHAGRPANVSYSPGAPQSSEISPSKAQSVPTKPLQSGRRSSPAHPQQQPKLQSIDLKSNTDWFTYQQRMLHSSQRHAPASDTTPAGAAHAANGSELHQLHPMESSFKHQQHPAAPAVSPGKRRACRSVSPAKKAANSASHRSISPGRSPSSSHSHAMAPWRSPGKQAVLLGRSGRSRSPVAATASRMSPSASRSFRGASTHSKCSDPQPEGQNQSKTAANTVHGAPGSAVEPKSTNRCGSPPFPGLKGKQCHRCGIDAAAAATVNCSFHPGLLSNPGILRGTPEYLWCSQQMHGKHTPACYTRPNHYFSPPSRGGPDRLQEGG